MTDTEKRKCVGAAVDPLPRFAEDLRRPQPERLITIPVSEYLYLNRIDAMMDVLLNDDEYSNRAAIDAVKAAVKELRHSMATAEAVAVE